MLRPRIIPCLLVRNGGLIKTVQFGDSKYVGDPINAVRIFNEKEVDELIVLDISATTGNREPDYNLIKNLAAECRMPFCYGGGVTTADQLQYIVSLGVEKVAISAAAIKNPDLISQAASRVGNQSVVIVIDVKKAGILRRHEIFIHNGKVKTGMDPVAFAETAEKLGAGEVVINSIDRDGCMKGYDLNLVKKVREAVSLPVTALGGAGSLDDLAQVIKGCGVSGAAAGSLFVFKGKYRAVLINYPSAVEKDKIFQIHR